MVIGGRGDIIVIALLHKAAEFSNESVSIPTEITKLCVDTQDNRIDVSIKINDSIFLIIEDKIYTGKHSNQIARYMKKAESVPNTDCKTWQHILAVYMQDRQ